MRQLAGVRMCSSFSLNFVPSEFHSPPPLPKKTFSIFRSTCPSNPSKIHYPSSLSPFTKFFGHTYLPSIPNPNSILLPKFGGMGQKGDQDYRISPEMAELIEPNGGGGDDWREKKGRIDGWMGWKFGTPTDSLEAEDEQGGLMINRNGQFIDEKRMEEKRNEMTIRGGRMA